jgi:hypothetical protein
MGSPGHERLTLESQRGCGVRVALGPNQLSAVPGKLRIVDWWEAIWTGVVIGLIVAAVVAGIHWYLERRESESEGG